MELDADASVAAATEVFLPEIQFSGGYTISAPGFSFERIANTEVIRFVADFSGRKDISIKRTSFPMKRSI